MKRKEGMKPCSNYARKTISSKSLVRRHARAADPQLHMIKIVWALRPEVRSPPAKAALAGRDGADAFTLGRCIVVSTPPYRRSLRRCPRWQRAGGAPPSRNSFLKTACRLWRTKEIKQASNDIFLKAADKPEN